MNTELSREETIALAATRAAELIDIVGINNLARLVGVQPSNIYRWMSFQARPNHRSGERLRMLDSCAAHIVDELDDPHAVVTWLYSSKMAGSSSPARELTAFLPTRTFERDLMNSARAFVRSVRRTATDPARHAGERQAAAARFIELVASSVNAGVLGDRGLDRTGRPRVYLRPAESVKHAGLVAEARGEAFDGNASTIGKGLALLGADTRDGKNSVPRRVAGRTVRVWAVPPELFTPVTPVTPFNPPPSKNAPPGF